MNKIISKKSQYFMIISILFAFLIPSNSYAFEEPSHRESIFILKVDKQQNLAAIIRKNGDMLTVKYDFQDNMGNAVSFPELRETTCSYKGSDFPGTDFTIAFPVRENYYGNAPILDYQLEGNIYNFDKEIIPMPSGINTTTSENTNSDIPKMHPDSPDPIKTRFLGDNRYETSAMIAIHNWSNIQTAILASGENFPDAIAATSLATQLKAPIILTKRNELPPLSALALWLLNVKNVIIIGGDGVVSYDMENYLRNTWGQEIYRIAGKDRYETSVLIAANIKTVTGGPVTEAVFVTGNNYANALSVSPYAAGTSMPIILMPQNYVPDIVKQYLAYVDLEKSYVIGDENDISSSTMNQLPNPQRIFGKDKYDTCYKLIEAFPGRINLSSIVVATGSDFPDALVGAAFAAQLSAPLLLLNPDSVDQNMKNFIVEYKDFTTKAYILGGEGALPTNLINAYFGW